MSIKNKKLLIKKRLAEKYGDVHNPRCVRALQLMDLMEESNIPIGYWDMKMRDFKGSGLIKKIVEQ